MSNYHITQLRTKIGCIGMLRSAMTMVQNECRDLAIDLAKENEIYYSSIDLECKESPVDCCMYLNDDTDEEDAKCIFCQKKQDDK